MVIITLVMTILRFLLNEKGRVNPDSIRYMRFAHVLPEVDNTITPLGYPVAIRFFTFFGTDEFWASKIVGIVSFLFIVFFAWKNNFYFRESVLACSIFSFVSIFSFTMSEGLMLPFVFLFLYVVHQILTLKISGLKAVFYLSLSLIALYNIRYSALFFIGGTGLFGLLSFRKSYFKTLIVSAVIGFAFIIGYKFLFIDRFNSNYVNEFLEIGLHSTSKLLIEFVQGMATSFNPFIHIADPNGGKINFAIYGIGAANLILMAYLFISKKLSDIDIFYLFTGGFGIVCSFFIQYFYSITPLDYRLLAPFTFPVWLVYFKKMSEAFGLKVYLVGFASLCSGFMFTWLSKGDYLENRKQITVFLEEENLDQKKILYYVKDIEDLDEGQIGELVSTVNADIDFTFRAEDTLKKTTLTQHKVLEKIKLRKNKFQ